MSKWDHKVAIPITTEDKRRLEEQARIEGITLAEATCRFLRGDKVTSGRGSLGRLTRIEDRLKDLEELVEALL